MKDKIDQSEFSILNQKQSSGIRSFQSESALPVTGMGGCPGICRDPSPSHGTQSYGTVGTGTKFCGPAVSDFYGTLIPLGPAKQGWASVVLFSNKSCVSVLYVGPERGQTSAGRPGPREKITGQSRMVIPRDKRDSDKNRGTVPSLTSNIVS